MSVTTWNSFQWGNYQVFTADTFKQKKTGLQFVNKLPPKTLVLFKDMPPGTYFHTVNCLFTIDIIALDSQNKILGVWTVIPNQKTIGPMPVGTKNVIETQGGWAELKKLKIGDNLAEALYD